jgi:type II secretory pathway component PulC
MNEKNPGQNIRNAMKKDIQEALRKQGKLTDSRKPDPDALPNIRLRRNMKWAAGSIILLIIVTGMVLSRNGSPGDVSNPGTIQGNEDGTGFADFYNPELVKDMTPEEANVFYQEAVKLEREEKKEVLVSKIDKQLDEQGIVFKGTVVDDWGLRAIMSLNNGPDGQYGTGETIGDARVMGIFPNRVVLVLDGQKFILSKNNPSFRPGGQSADRFIIPVSSIDDWNKDPRKLYDDLRRLSELGGGRLDYSFPQGLRVEDPGYSLADAGLKSGDLIKSINYIPLNGRSDAVRVLGSISGLDTIPVEYEREGRLISTELHVQ